MKELAFLLPLTLGKEWKNMDFYKMKKEDIFKELSATEDGLSSVEVSERLKKYGKNEIAEEKAQSPIMVFLGQYKDFLVIILIKFE